MIRTCHRTTVRRVCLRRGWVRLPLTGVDRHHHQVVQACSIHSIPDAAVARGMMHLAPAVPAGCSLAGPCPRNLLKRSETPSKPK